MFGFMGLQFIFLWIIGEYIGRIYNETRARPNFVIKETQNFEQAENFGDINLHKIGFIIILSILLINKIFITKNIDGKTTNFIRYTSL